MVPSPFGADLDVPACELQSGLQSSGEGRIRRGSGRAGARSRGRGRRLARRYGGSHPSSPRDDYAVSVGHLAASHRPRAGTSEHARNGNSHTSFAAALATTAVGTPPSRFTISILR